MSDYNPYLLPIRLEPGRPFAVAKALAILHAATLVVIATLDLDFKARVALVLIVIASAFSHGRRWARNDEDAILEAVLWPDDSWTLTTSLEQDRPAQMTTASLVRPWLTVICLRTDSGRSRTLILVPGTVNAESLRHLRVRLNYRIDGGRNKAPP